MPSDSMQLLVAEMHMEQSSDWAAWDYARAAACRWYHPLRRLLLIRRARLHERDADSWRRRYHAEIRAFEHRWLDEEPGQ